LKAGWCESGRRDADVRRAIDAAAALQPSPVEARDERELVDFLSYAGFLEGPNHRAW
jgi:hypothetical protein